MRISAKARAIAIVTVAVLAGAGLLALAFLPRGGSLPASGDVPIARVTDLVAQGARLVDVRTAAEFDTGHIAGAENVPMDALTQQAASWDKSVAIVVYCATGARSRTAYEYLRAQGFQRVYNGSDGIAAYTGALVKGGAAAGSAASGQAPATGRPVMYDFYTDS